MDDADDSGGDKRKRNRINTGGGNTTTKFLRTLKETMERRNSMLNELHKTRKWIKLKNGICSTKRQQIHKQPYKTVVY
jgi:hypothetical protein